MRRILLAVLLLLSFTTVPQPVQAEDLCCVSGYSESWFQCPWSRPANTCCKRHGFADYEVVPKISCDLVNIDTSIGLSTATAVCRNIVDPTTKQSCIDCFSQNKAWTAIGCIPSDPAGFLQTFLTFGIGIAGGIAFLLILLSGFQMMTAAGNPEQLNAGRELAGSAVTGLILIIFSVFLLRLIGYDILRIPGFGQ